MSPLGRRQVQSASTKGEPHDHAHRTSRPPAAVPAPVEAGVGGRRLSGGRPAQRHRDDPTHNLPGPVRAYADHQPLTATVNAIRPLLLGGPAAPHAVAALLWCAGIIAVFAPLAVLRYRRAA